MNLQTEICCLKKLTEGVRGVKVDRVPLPLSGPDDPRGGELSYAFDDDPEDGILYLKLGGVWRGISTFGP